VHFGGHFHVHEYPSYNCRGGMVCPLYTRSQDQNVHLKSSISIGAKVEKLFSTCPKLVINAELDALVLAPRLKKGYLPHS